MDKVMGLLRPFLGAIVVAAAAMLIAYLWAEFLWPIDVMGDLVLVGITAFCAFWFGTADKFVGTRRKLNEVVNG